MAEVPNPMHLKGNSLRAQATTSSNHNELVPEMAALADLALFARAGEQAVRLARRGATADVAPLISSLAGQGLIALRSSEPPESSDSPQDGFRRIAAPSAVLSGEVGRRCIEAMEALKEGSGRLEEQTLEECGRVLRDLVDQLRKRLSRMEQEYYQMRNIRSI